MKTYAYRTTTQKLEDGTAAAHVEESGDTVVSSHFLGGRDWVLICRTGSAPSVTDLSPDELEDLIARAVRAGVEPGIRDAIRDVVRAG